MGTERVAATTLDERPSDYRTLVDEARIAARRARDSANILRGIPAFMSMYDSFDRIARDLEHVLAKQGHHV